MLSEKLYRLSVRARNKRGSRMPLMPHRTDIFPINYHKPHTLCVCGDPLPEEKKPNENYIKTPDVSENYKSSP